MVNAELLDRVMNKIQEEPFLWNQNDYLAFTQDEIDRTEIKKVAIDGIEFKYHDVDFTQFYDVEACFAGWTVLLSGFKPQVLESKYDTVIYNPDSQELNVVGFAARELLNINGLDAGYLFDSNNDIDVLSEMVIQLKNGSRLSNYSWYF